MLIQISQSFQGNDTMCGVVYNTKSVYPQVAGSNKGGLGI